MFFLLNVSDLSAAFHKLTSDMRTGTYVEDGLQVQDYPNNKNMKLEVQVIQSLAESDNETADYDDASIMSQLITTSQEVEANVNASDKVCVVVMDNVDGISAADEIYQENGREDSGITDIKTISDFPPPVMEMQNVGIENVNEIVTESVVYQDIVNERKSMSDCRSSSEASPDNVVNESSENVVNESCETNDVMIEIIREPDDFVSDLGKENDSKSQDLNIQELNAYDLEEKIRLSTLVDLDGENDGEPVSGIKTEKVTNGGVEGLVVRKRGRPKKSKVKSEPVEVKIKLKKVKAKRKKSDLKKGKKKKKQKLEKITDDEKSEDKDSKQDCSKDEPLNSSLKDSKEDSCIDETLNSSSKEEFKVPSMEEFKSMVEIWALKNEEKPVLFSNVHFGTRLKPVEKPDDLDENFYSASKNGYFCSNCSLLFKLKTSFIKHRFNTDGRCYYECDVCMKKFMVRSELNCHRKYHSNVKPFICTLCNQSYTRRNTLNLHIQQNHQDKSKYSCFICGKLFKIRPCLLRHLKLAHIKEEEKVALCSQCPKRFKSFNDLKAHAKTHTAEKRFPCDVCHKPLKTVKYMKEHRKTHFQERHIVCEICGKGFFKLEHLKNHMLLHTGLKPFACTICSYRCTVKCNLVKHMKTHSKHS